MSYFKDTKMINARINRYIVGCKSVAHASELVGGEN